MTPLASPFRVRNLRTEWILVLGIALAVLARILHWIVADRVWEDALITLAHVRNAVEGNGLTHHPGEGLVHGFTSALSVIVPLLGELFVHGSGLTTLRLVSITASVVAVATAFWIARRLGVEGWGLAFVVTYLALDQLQIFFGMSGMETQIATAVILLGSAAVLRGQHLLAGLLAGIGILARPDFLLWAAIVIAWAAWLGRPALLRTAGGITAVVTPWLAVTVWQYGSPIPQTIIAKGLAYPTVPGLSAAPGEWLTWIVERGGFGLLAIIAGLTPFYEDGLTVAAPVPAGWLAGLGLIFAGLALRGALISWRMPGWRPTLAYVVGFAAYWALLLPLGYFMWYQPPFLALVAILCGVGISSVVRWRSPVGATSAIVLMLAFSIHLPWTLPLDQKTQIEIEDGVRRASGEYLSEVVAPGESVLSEAAGYPGWYGRVELWDYPGLTSPTTLRAVRELDRDHRTITNTIAVLLPDWLLLRPHEWDALRDEHPHVSRCYVVARAFGEPSPQSVEHHGLVRWNQDRQLLVLRRNSECRT